MKRVLSVLLLLCLLAPVFAGCSDNPSQGSGDTTAPSGSDTVSDTSDTAEQTEERDDVPADLSYNGFEFVIYNTNDPANSWYTTTFVTAEEDSAEVINSAIYNRNLALEDRFGIKISEQSVKINDVTNSITANDAAFSIALERGFDAIAQAQLGYLVDLNKVPYINLDKSYWDQAARNQLNIADKLFIGVGDFITTNHDETIVMFFSKKLINDYNLENPYDLVRNYKWTLDKVSEMGAKVIKDLDGNGKMNDQDQYALMSWSGVGYPFLFLGTGVNYMTLDENKKPVITADSDRFISAYEKIISMTHSEGDNFFYDANIRQNTRGFDNNHRVQEPMFREDKALFWMEVVSWSKALREMDTDFGIVTAPMYDENQKKYYNYCNCNFYAIVVPTTADLERTGAIVEAMNSESKKTVTPAYYDVMLKSKYSRDEDSGEMLDIIFNNLVYDIGSIYSLGSINSGIYDLAAKNSTDLASYLAKQSKALNKQIDKMMEKLAALDEG